MITSKIPFELYIYISQPCFKNIPNQKIKRNESLLHFKFFLKMQ
jgi:hypothetical protein